MHARFAKGTVYALAASALLLVPGAATAEGPPPDYTREGWYIQAQGLYALENFQDFDVEDDTGFNVLFGWRGWEMFGGDFEFEWVNRFPGNNLGPDYRTFSIAALFRIYPLARLFEADSWGNRFQPYLKAGPGWQWIERRGGGIPNNDRGDFSPRFGGGIDMYVTENWVITAGASYQWPIARVNNFNYATFGAGVQYRFGGRED